MPNVRRGGVVIGRLVDVADTKLFVDERGELSAFPLLVLHGGPGLDHTMFGDYLDSPASLPLHLVPVIRGL